MLGVRKSIIGGYPKSIVEEGVAPGVRGFFSQNKFQR